MGSLKVTDHVQRLVEDNAPDLLAYFLRRVEVAEDAADLLNEVLLVIWRKAGSLPGDHTEARMWMFGVARNVLSTHRRASGRRSALHERLREQLAEPHGGDDQDGDGSDVQAALAQLEPLDQEVMRLLFWDGFSQAQVAALLGMPEGTVRSRTHRARQRMKQTLGAASLG